MDNKIHIDKNTQLVLLYSSSKNDWEEKTFTITAIYKSRYYGNFTGYNIYFKGGSSKFFYRKENVIFLNKKRDIDIDRFDVYAGNIMMKATKLELFESDYYRVHEGNNIIVCKNITLKSNRYRDILTYYYKLAWHANLISEENSPLSLLLQQYKRFSQGLANTVLNDYLHGEYKLTSHLETDAILAFDFNQSQRAATENALKSNISVIEGPPGTGKTQTILNLIASIIYQGKNCAVISNNNTAIDNVYEKLKEQRLAFFAARLGSRENVQLFFDDVNNDELKIFMREDTQALSMNEKARIKQLGVQIKKIHDAEIEMAQLETELAEISNEERHYDGSENEVSSIRTDLKPKHYLELMLRLEKPLKLGFIEKIILRLRFRSNLKDQSITNLLRALETLYYRNKIKELNQKIAKNRQFLDNQNKEWVCDELKYLYREALKCKLHKHYKNHGANEFSASTYKKQFNNFINRYPVILSTTHSLLYNIPQNFTFDYLIIDEASQGDLLSTIPAINCAKNLVVVGDSRQLQQIDEVSLYAKSRKLAEELNIQATYHYEANSILKSVKESVKEAPVTLLREHYRCAPDIINFCNKMFYDGELVVMTQNQGKHIEIIKTVPGNHARKNPEGSGLYNQREIDVVADILKTSNARSIGVITPFRLQADCIHAMQSNTNVEADTIHKFQGRQKDEVILSFVVNSLEKNPEQLENRLFNFVTNNQLFNVAISRAKNKITAIVSDKVYNSNNNVISDFIKYAEYLYGSEISRESAVKSVFDVLYSDYSKLLISKFRQKPNAHKTELLMCEIIEELLAERRHIGYVMHTRLSSLVTVPENFSEEERSYILHPWTHVDFLFYNKITKERLFVLEVDGIRYHEQNKKQTVRDQIKDKVLQSNNLPCYRFKTNESNEKGRLNEILRAYNLNFINT